VLDRFLSVDKTYSHCFLSERLVPIPGPISHSYGHDIEACWLVEAAAEALADAAAKAEARQAVATLARATIAAGQMDDGSFILERKADGPLNRWRIWWGQAEALVGIINEAEQSGMPDGFDRAEKAVELHCRPDQGLTALPIPLCPKWGRGRNRTIKRDLRCERRAAKNGNDYVVDRCCSTLVPVSRCDMAGRCW
jgi:hypothetical protein